MQTTSDPSDFSAHTIRLRDGVKFFYTDSGAPSDSTDYTTVLLLHGSAFTGQSFTKLHAYAHKSNLRTIALNRRDYPPTTKYTPCDLDDLKNGNRDFLDRIALQLAEFLVLFIQLNQIPRINHSPGGDGTKGGIAVLGWSMGSASALALFSDRARQLLPRDSYEFLEPFMKVLILNDPPHLAMGYDLPVDADPSVLYDVWETTTGRSVDCMYKDFKAWVSSYYDHPIDPKSINELDCSPRTLNATTDAWTDEDWEKCYDQEAAIRSEWRMYYPPMQPTIKEMARSTLLPDDITKIAFPDTPVIFLVPNRTNWQCFWGTRQAKRDYDEATKQGKKVRKTSFVPIEGGNHFVHWDKPKEFVNIVGDCVQPRSEGLTDKGK